MTLWYAIIASTWAATVEVELSVDGDLLTRGQVESVVWHALARDLDHDAVFVEPGHGSSTPGLTRWRMNVSWDPQVLHVEDHLFATLAPRVRIHDENGEHQWLGTAIVLDHDEHGWVSLPDAALMRTLDRAAPQLDPATWHATAETRELRLVVAVDEELRTTWGDDWVAQADRRIAHANLLLQHAAIELTVVGYEAIESREDANLHTLLRELDARPMPERAALRVGFSGQVRAEAATNIEDIAVAYVPGQTVLLADQIPATPTLASWDAAEEGTALAHEVLHALGIPHLEVPGQLMSEFKAGMLHELSPAAIHLAAAAMEARATLDPLHAVLTLGEAANGLQDRSDAIAYVTHNLAAGIGVPHPAMVDPERLSTLTNIAVGHYYLRQADRSPAQASRYRRTAALHSRAAFASIDPRDDWTPLLNEFADALCGESPWRDTHGRHVCAEVSVSMGKIQLSSKSLIELAD